MLKICHTLLLFLFLTGSATADTKSDVVSNTLDPMTINYTVNLDSDKLGKATLGTLETTLRKTEFGYAVNSQTKAQGFAAILIGSNIEENCQFAVMDNRTVSAQYSGGTKKKTDYNVTFDWQDRKVGFDDANILDMPKGYLVDNCNLPFAAALSRGQDFNGDTLYVVDGKKQRIRGYVYKSTNEETLNTDIGDLETIKLVLQREFKPERTLTLWLAPSQSYLPIKMEEKRKSRTTTMMVSKIDTDKR